MKELYKDEFKEYELKVIESLLEELTITQLNFSLWYIDTQDENGQERQRLEIYCCTNEPADSKYYGDEIDYDMTEASSDLVRDEGVYKIEELGFEIEEIKEDAFNLYASSNLLITAIKPELMKTIKVKCRSMRIEMVLMEN